MNLQEQKEIFKKVCRNLPDLIKETLKKNGELTLIYEGMSMFPTLKSGQKILIKPINQPLKPGDIICFAANRKIISHRFIKYANSSKTALITKGDSFAFCDNHTVNLENLLGVISGDNPVLARLYWLFWARVGCFKEKIILKNFFLKKIYSQFYKIVKKAAQLLF